MSSWLAPEGTTSVDRWHTYQAHAQTVNRRLIGHVTDRVGSRHDPLAPSCDRRAPRARHRSVARQQKNAEARRPAEMDETKRRIFDALQLGELAPAVWALMDL
jgi:hypothetical protein